jgi:hypothetical protein
VRSLTRTPWRALQNPRQRCPRIGPVPDHLARLDRGFTPPYEISYRGLKLPRVSAAHGRSYLRRGADLSQVGRPRSLLNKRNKIGNRNSNSFARAGNMPPVVGKNMNTPSVDKKNNRPADNTLPADKKDTQLADNMNTQPAGNKRARAGSKPGQVGSNKDYSRGEQARNRGRKIPARGRQRHQGRSHLRPRANPNLHLHLRAAAPSSIRSR